MKKLVLASAIAALSVTAAHAAPQVYGKVFLSVDMQDGNNNSSYKDARTQLNSNASRIGVKGSEALTENTDVVYQLEYRLDTDAAGQRNWESRDTYLGVANKQYGTLVAGRLTAIDGYIDYANVTDGGVIGGDNVLASVDAPRANNAFAYFSPERQGLQFMGMYALDENNGSDTLNGDAFGVGVKYEPSGAPYRAGVTYIKASNAAKDRLGNDAKLQAIRVSGAYDLSPAVTVGGLYQNTNYNVGKENAYTVSGQYKVANTPWTAYGQLDLVDEVEGALDATRQRVAIGGKYAFSKAATGHLYGAYMRSQNIDLSPAGQAQVAPNANAKANAYGVGVGLEYKF